MDWNYHNNNIYDKAIYWFEVIRPKLYRPGILLENVYNMDEIGTMFSILGSIKVLVGKDD